MWPKTLCLDNPSEIILQGDLTSENVQGLTFNLLGCVEPEGTENESKKCKSKEEIDAMTDTVQLVFAYNKETYEPNLYGEDVITREADYHYLSLNSKTSELQEMMIHK